MFRTSTYNVSMFFRHVRPKQITLEERLENLKAAGFAIQDQGGGRVRVSRNGCAAVLEKLPAGTLRETGTAGILLGDEIAGLIDCGFQKFFQTPAGKRKPALASELKALHDFQEDLRETLGLVSLYNEA